MSSLNTYSDPRSGRPTRNSEYQTRCAIAFLCAACRVGWRRVRLTCHKISPLRVVWRRLMPSCLLTAKMPKRNVGTHRAESSIAMARVPCLLGNVLSASGWLSATTLIVFVVFISFPNGKGWKSHLSTFSCIEEYHRMIQFVNRFEVTVSFLNLTVVQAKVVTISLRVCR